MHVDGFNFVFYLNFGNQAGAGLDDVGRGDEGRMLFHDKKNIDFEYKIYPSHRSLSAG
jgi:hypothetical protein